jgi:hypothetical protein
MGFELRASCLLGRNSSALTMTPAIFAMVILELGSHFFPKLAWTEIILFMLPASCWDDRLTLSCLALFNRDGDLINFFLPGLAWNLDPPYLSLPCS